MPPLDENAVVTPDEIRAYATGDLGWAQLRDRGVNYYQVLAGLGDLGLRPPMAPMIGPNVEARQRGIKLLQEVFGEAAEDR